MAARPQRGGGAPAADRQIKAANGGETASALGFSAQLPDPARHSRLSHGFLLACASLQGRLAGRRRRISRSSGFFDFRTIGPQRPRRNSEMKRFIKLF
jgi:hypothetical protein